MRKIKLTGWSNVVINVTELKSISKTNTAKLPKPADMGFSLEEIEDKLRERAGNGFNCYFYYTADREETENVIEYFSENMFTVRVIPAIDYNATYYAIVQICW